MQIELRWLNSTQGEVRRLQYRMRIGKFWTEWISVPEVWIQ